MTRRTIQACALTAAMAAPAAAQAPQLVLDINPVASSLPGTEPKELTAFAGALFYVGSDDENGPGIRRRDASGATSLLLDTRPGTFGFGGDGPTELTVSNGRLLFVHDEALWRSDGTTAGTERFFDWLDVSPAILTEAAGLVFFRAQGFGPQQGLWRTDGTPGGTVFLTDGYPDVLTAAGARLFFAKQTPATGLELWTSDGTPAGTHLVTDLCPGMCPGLDDDALVAIGSTAYFGGSTSNSGTSAGLWRSDGTAAGTSLVSTHAPFEPGTFGSRLLFQSDGPTSGFALWTSDGTTGGTVQVHASLRVWSTYHDAGGVAYFGARAEGAGEDRLWKTDGTPAGTVAVTPPCGGCLNFSGTEFVTLPAATLFTSYASDGMDLWHTDGTAAGTFAIGATDLFAPLVRFGDAACFPHTEAVHGQELWRSDGTAPGTVRLTDRVDVSSDPRPLTALGKRFFFSAERPDLGSELWSTNGPAASTTFVDVVPGPNSAYLNGAVALDNVVLIGLVEPSFDRSLLRSDGTPAGTLRLQTNLYVGALGRAADRAVFGGGFSSSLLNVWRSDGTPEGTVEVAAVAGGSNGPRPFAPFLDRSAFVVDGGPARGLWTTDGSAEGTIQLSALTCLQAAAAEEKLFAVCQAPGGQLQLWVTDGTADGMRLLDEWPGEFVGGLTPVESFLYFTVGVDLWRSDGTVAGTQRLADIVGTSIGDSPSPLAGMNGVLFFTATTPATGRELWRTDGTPAGTFLVRDAWPGPDSGFMSGFGSPGFAAAGARLYFPGYTPATGIELWQSDGTTAGTGMVGEIASGPASSDPQYFGAAGAHVYFAASDNLRGFEPWTVTVPTPVFTMGDVVVREGDAGSAVAAFEVRLEPASAAATTVSYTTVAGTAQAGADFTPQSGTLTFPAGVTSTVIPVPVLGDLQDEADETFTVQLSSPGGVFADARGSAVILDDDGPRATAAGTTVVEGDAGTSAATFAVTLTTHDGTPTPAAKSVGYATAPVTATSGTDYAATSGTLTFPAGTASGTTLTVTVDVNGDTLDEPDETFALRFTSTSDVAVPPPAIATVTDDDGIDAASPVELQPGASLRATLEPPAGRSSDRDYYVLAQQPYASYELVIDETSGDAVPLSVERIAADGSTVLQAGTAVGTGAGVSLRWQNSTSALVTNEHVAVSSASCGTSCGDDDRYRVRLYETTLSAARFNNANGQGTVVLLQNRSDATVSGHVALWVPPSTLVRYEPFTIAPRGVLALNTLPLWPGSGSITVTHDGAYGGLVGKAVSLEPSTGFSFDTPLTSRPR